MYEVEQQDSVIIIAIRALYAVRCEKIFSTFGLAFRVSPSVPFPHAFRHVDRPFDFFPKASVGMHTVALSCPRQ